MPLAFSVESFCAYCQRYGF